MNTTMKHGSIVVGVDGSPGSDAALEWAVAQAMKRRRPLMIVNGAGDPKTSAHYVGSDEARRTLKMEARRLTDHAYGVVRQLDPTLDVQVTTPLCDARSALLDLSERASLIVVGTRGRGPVTALILGSVSTAIAEHASCPVAVVRPAERPEGEGLGRIVVGVDGEPSSTAALDYAFELASAERRELDVVHTWSDNDTFIDRSSHEQRLDRIERHHRLLVEALAGYGEKYPDVAVHQHMPDGSAVATLVAMSEEAWAVVVGSRGRTGIKALLSSVSRGVLEHAHCTVVVVRP